jgi:hypothetical protein
MDETWVVMTVYSDPTKDCVFGTFMTKEGATAWANKRFEHVDEMSYNAVQLLRAE